MKTFMAKAGEVEKKWYVVDVQGKVLGRAASEVAKILRGKHKPQYTPHVDTGDYVIVINADKVVLTGKKLDQKVYRRHTGWIGNLKEIKYRRFLETRPERVFELAVKRMLPSNSLGRKMFKKLKVYAGDKHNHQAQKPEVLELNI
ncbi:50S ribosomal protein L13 [Thermoclostridium caenicola]|uniref:Large ribosomal subunit protein uL13 n=1 Tax=Thermoclostridium caenicola TaxID=659425 RepID=A0A1M6FIE5_9FIRM|nr:50S ribosomal protein L13 [Thermoclostridium caenicola]SHI97382.1 LSU ribosomal protein L13P [Thermoclostridium caenicola]HOL84107.1 50S ribosomal protein L13 [Thermoclostridium caenicola]HPO76208.1 50S ribosomal protein L13 [Thermoclostridium caenicola]